MNGSVVSGHNYAVQAYEIVVLVCLKQKVVTVVSHKGPFVLLVPM